MSNPTDRAAGRALLFPDPQAYPGRAVLGLDVPEDGLPELRWVVPPGTASGAEDRVPATGVGAPGCQLLLEHAGGRWTRPALRGYRTGARGTGRDWSTAFTDTGVDVDGDHLRVRARDHAAGLELRTDLDSLPGGGLRARHTLTNTAADPYVLEGLEVVFPAPPRATEILDFTGRWGAERVPQRHAVADGLWLRENRHGKTGHDAATVVAVGTPGFGFGDGELWAVSIAWSGNSVYRVERTAASSTTVGAGELLLPGELVLAEGDAYTTPWVHLVVADDGLDGVAAGFHGWLRSLPAHPASPVPVNLNVWEAVYFDHDLDRLRALADRAARIGVERFVLDDGWFGARRDDTAGLGDWTVSPDAWPAGLGPLVEHVRGLGMTFGLWFEPEMVNPDSDLYRAHPDWILAAGGRVPTLARHQLVLDLSRAEVRQYLLDQLSAVLSAHDIGYVKWDHNRDLLEAGSGTRAGAPAVHQQTLGFYTLLDDLRDRFPAVQWESCASGGGRIDLGVLARTQRVWASDVTDALSRHGIQRWTGQLVPPEYVGAHVSAPVSHQTGRGFPLAFRAGTALFGSFGIEWDIGGADEAELAELASWIGVYREYRALLHSGRVVRVETGDPGVWVHGVVAADRSAALMAYVQLGESPGEVAVPLRIPGLDPGRAYVPRWVGPVPRPGRFASTPTGVQASGPTAGEPVPGGLLAEAGLEVPRQPPHTVTLVGLAEV